MIWAGWKGNSMTVEISGRSTRRIGYVVTILVNGVVLFIMNSLLNWEWPPWLTPEFAEVLPLINASILATMIVTTIYLFYDAPAFKQLAEMLTLAISIAATARTLSVYPFDFSAYTFNWDIVMRGILVVALFGMTVGLIVNLVKLIAGAVSPEAQAKWRTIDSESSNGGSTVEHSL